MSQPNQIQIVQGVVENMIAATLHDEHKRVGTILIVGWLFQLGIAAALAAFGLDGIILCIGAYMQDELEVGKDDPEAP